MTLDADASVIPIEKQERDGRAEQTDGTRDAQRGVSDGRLERQVSNPFSLRKSFAQRVSEQSGDIYLVQALLGHRSVATTQKYIGVNYATARQAVEGMALAC